MVLLISFESKLPAEDMWETQATLSNGQGICNKMSYGSCSCIYTSWRSYWSIFRVGEIWQRTSFFPESITTWICHLFWEILHWKSCQKRHPTTSEVSVNVQVHARRLACTCPLIFMFFKFVIKKGTCQSSDMYLFVSSYSYPIFQIFDQGMECSQSCFEETSSYQ